MRKSLKFISFLFLLVVSLIIPDVLTTRAEETATTKMTFHYHRDDGEYNQWNVWLWQYEPAGKDGSPYTFTDTDSYGGYFTVDLTDETSSLFGSTALGFIIRKGEWADRDIASDRLIYLPETAPDGNHHVYLYQGFTEVYSSFDEAMYDKIAYARFLDVNTLSVKVSSQKVLTKADFHLYVDEVEDQNFQFAYDHTTGMITATLVENVKFDKSYRVEIDFQTGKREILCDSSFLYDTAEFRDNYTYYGDDLGVTFNEDRTRTTFKVWAPLASEVRLNIYNTGTPKVYGGTDTPVFSYLMQKEQQGVWVHTEKTNMHGIYYTFTTVNGGIISETSDPYGYGVGINGVRSLVVDFERINEEIGFEKGVRPNLIDSPTDAIIYEMHIRDLTSDETWTGSEENRGRYLGVVEEGTTYTENNVTVKTGFDHLKELGVTHVQILPFYDQGTVDESVEHPTFNWGYDPVNYNALEGSYSSNPFDGLTRIYEFKQMMMKLTEAGLAVNMDVVYNHTLRGINSNMNLIVPNYYFRLTETGDFSNGSGCGNEVASERPMARKFIVESSKFWFEEYNLSGFRFDLMGLIDTTTMEQVYKAVEPLYDKAMVYGEPWTGGATPNTYVQSNQGTIIPLEGIGAFNDQMRDAIKGSASGNDGAFVQSTNFAGNDDKISKIKNGISGKFTNSTIEPYKVINYVACHDNYTLHDKIDITKGSKNLKMMNNQADSIVLLSQGVPFIQLGQDFLRSKPKDPEYGVGDKYDHNSYRSPDSVNSIKWDEKVKYNDVFNYYQDLIEIRKEHSSLRLATRAEINQNLVIDNGPNPNVISYKLTEGTNTLYIIHATTAMDFTLDGTYTILLDRNGKATGTAAGSISLQANESVVLYK